ncbi:PrgI family protein [Spirillospora sp. CA-253888]
MPRHLLDAEPPAARIPADIDQPDKILYGLTVRQTLILAATGLVCAGLYALAEPWLPLPVIAGLLLPVVAFGAVVAVARRDGLSLDRLALSALLHIRTARERVPAGVQVTPPPAWCRMRGKLPAPLRLPVRAVREDGVMELAGGEAAVLVQAATISFGLRTASEQGALVAGFGRWLNSLETPVQILIQTRTVDLSGLADHFTASASGLPDPALEAAALDHAAYLDQVNATYPLLTRQVLLVVRDAAPPASVSLAWLPGRQRRAARQGGAVVVQRRAAEAVTALASLGITAHVLDATACTTALAQALNPGESALAGITGPDEVITAQQAAQEATA